MLGRGDWDHVTRGALAGACGAVCCVALGHTNCEGLSQRGMWRYAGVGAGGLVSWIPRDPSLVTCRDAEVVNHEDFVEGITQVQAKKKSKHTYYV